MSSEQLVAAAIGALVGAVVVLLFRRTRSGASSSGRAVDTRDPAVEVARLRGELRRSDARYQRQVEFFVNFPELVKALTAAMTIEQVTATSSRGISALLQTHAVSIWLAESADRLRLVDGAGFSPKLRDKLTATIDELGARDVLRQRGVLPLDPSAGSLLRRHGIAADLLVPIWHGERLFGMLTIAGAAGEAAVIHRTLAMIADLTGVGLLAASQISKIRQEAEIDALTGLTNRRILFRRVSDELSRCFSYGTHLSLAMIDIDHFKHFNDTNGHQAGDEALKLVAKLIRSVTRRTDVVGRYGGEEFTVVLLGADRVQAQQHADRIRRTIAETRFPHGETQPLGYVSISVGVATMPLDAETREQLFEAADKALYLAKQRGRDRVCAYEGTGPGAGPLISDDFDIVEEFARDDATLPERAIARAIEVGK
ncbi:MAG: sensor domain-containing diguanylate cyclase [Deltaproteobacteria bacterium]|nr:sensor domain-containing diguanylate cyclase [Deltaproteobacteria bacterium]